MTEPEDIYDSPELYDMLSTGVPGDVAYFSKLAKQAKRVLELATGTGRVTIPMARAGAKVTGIELRDKMLAAADEHLSAEKPEVRQRVELFQGDMRAFDLGKTFPLIVIPFRAFQHLIDVRDQRACLECCRDHLTRQGSLVINLFDPNLKILASSLAPNATASRKVGEVELKGGERVVAFATRTSCPEEQWFEEDWVYECFDKGGRSQWRRSRKFRLRWFGRYEMEHMFELCGLEVEKLEGGFKGQAYHHGGEQIWTVRRV
ncbi:MAG: class I SAM-dependent methyltransferase [Planctomycetes bacterium]|nr:class I SAM-dependent methyltransferase [Planctomycetota bacterium]